MATQNLPNRLPNRWLIAVAAILIQICCGAVYSWSVFVKPMLATEPWTLVQVSATFTITLACIGIGAVVGGLWQDRSGPRLVASFAGVLYGVGFFVAAAAVSHHSLFGLYAGYGVLGGIAIGIAYICPVANITKWFPDKRGLMIGATVMGYGAGAVIMSPIAARLIIRVGVADTFQIFGAAYLVIIVVAAQFHIDPPHGWRPEGMKETAATRRAGTVDFTVMQAMKTWRFWLLWLMLSLNVSAGIMIISQASPLAQQQAGMTVLEASAAVGVISIFNAIGRVFWSWMSDLVGRAQVYFALYAIQVFLFFFLPRVHQAMMFEIVVCAIALCYGGGFAVIPSFVADFFGSKYIGGIYGWIVLATWAVAAIPSPLLIAHVRETTGTYEYAIFVIGFVMLLSLPLPVLAGRAVSRASAARALQNA
ncbi:MAG TPA: OFA family MFS transporter [Bryobacteraceae bacterium]|nr:OFA family MFS transporter [Bryobacteraceae bacterium]